MEGRPSFTSFVTSSLRSPFRGPVRQRQASEEDEGGPSHEETTKSSYERRRFQVKKAQKKHRQKKEDYVMALEEETQRLRRALYDSRLENNILKDALSAHGIAMSEWSSPSQSEIDFAHVALIGIPGPDQYLQVQVPDSTGLQSLIAEAAGPMTSHASHTAIPSSDQRAVPELKANAQHNPGEDACSADGLFSAAASFDDSSIDFAGFQFVLALERPCLPHTGHPSISSGMPGHVFTLNAATLACAPSNISPNQYWSVPAASLERLLELSNNLGMGFGTLTPIQAWQRIREHPQFSILSPEKLQELIAILSKEMKCHGFGAAVKEKTFDVILDRVFKQ